MSEIAGYMKVYGRFLVWNWLVYSVFLKQLSGVDPWPMNRALSILVFVSDGFLQDQVVSRWILMRASWSGLDDIYGAGAVRRNDRGELLRAGCWPRLRTSRMHKQNC